MRKERIYAALCLGLCVGTFQAVWGIQRDSTDALACYNLRHEEDLPRDIFSARSACILSFPAHSQKGAGFAKKIQAYFQKVGLDVVWYADSANVFMGNEVLSHYGAALRKRHIKYLLFYSSGHKKDAQVNLRIIPVAEEKGLITPGSPMWSYGASTLKALYKAILNAKMRQKLPESNMLINENVEIMPFPTFLNNQIHRSIPNDIHQFFIAVMLPASSNKEAAVTCLAWQDQEQQLRKWFKNHPSITHTFVRSAEFLPKGYEYVLHTLGGMPTALDVFLKAPKRTSELAEIDQKVYAMYLTHLLTGTVHVSYRYGKDIASVLDQLFSVQ